MGLAEENASETFAVTYEGSYAFVEGEEGVAGDGDGAAYNDG